MDSSESKPATQPRPLRRPSCRHIAWVTAGTVICAAGILLWTGRSAETPHQSQAGPAHSPDALASPPNVRADPDDRLTDALLGTWKREFHGEWLMTVNEDGTGTIEITPAGIWSVLIGERVTVNLQWSVQDGRADLKSVGGQPEGAFTAAVKIFGARRIRKIKELTDNLLILLDEEDGSEAQWVRVEKPEAL